ncbi:MAG: DUF1836 domain-containing protein [Defluviitaleaceae bacterium]|nr:DUF1836 domain-containing protein [Defluviitaleaceae bacterium]
MTDPLHDIRHYSPTLTISQVMKFCEKKGLNITRAMIQNYVRDKLLPPPVNKRFYTHKHLAALVLIERLKTVFDIPTITRALLPFMDNEGIPLDIYQSVFANTEKVTQNWFKANASTINEEKDNGILLVMACAAQLKSAVIG